MAVMATQPRMPGVYLELETRRPQPLLETGVPLFLGRLRPFGDSGRWLSPLRDGSVIRLGFSEWAALEQAVGTAWADGYLGFAVRGFFENGGRRCYVFPLESRSLIEALGPGSEIEALDDFDLLCAPDSAGVSEEQIAMLGVCERRPGCFALLDTSGEGRPSRDALPEPALGEMGLNGALFGPWIKVLGACRVCNGAGRTAGICGTCSGTGQGFVPPSGHLAGVIARTDQRIGPHKAPANEPIEGALDVGYALGSYTVACLNALGVNCIRALPLRGIRAWGARTLAPSAPGFSHINTRRVYLSTLRWLEQSMAEMAFEPNNYRLWMSIEQQVSSYLEGLFQKGALFGASKAEAFYIKCDAETNTPEQRERGRVVAEVGLALARPAEFVVVRLIAGPSGVSATTLV